MLNEDQVLQFWNENNIFQKSLDKPNPNGTYTFYDGPPFATGLPHYGHILASTIKDVVPRYQTMLGKRVDRRWGWDCHGLPIENIVEKDLHISGKNEIEAYGIGKFNEHAESKVLTYIHDWRQTVNRIGRWVDFDGSYKTMDTTYIESVWWAFKEMTKKDLVYQTTRVLPYCPRCETTVSNSEIAMDNSYKDITDISVYVKLKLLSDPNTSLLVWTTTPWTLPGNAAVAINPNFNYLKVKVILSDNNGEKTTENVIVAEKLFKQLDKFFQDKSPEIIDQFSGNKLIGESYQPLFDYYSKTDLKNKENGWKIYSADYVTDESGTGLVHIAPVFGEEDMALARENHIPEISHIGPDGKMKKEVLDFAGLTAKPKENHQSTDIEIIKHLAHHNQLFAKEKIIHSYPHCFRCETPLFYYALPAWFIKISEVKDDLLKLNENINWIPQHLKDGRFKKSVASAPDWNISRTRYWASPLPIWVCKKCSKIEFIGSINELKEKSNNFSQIWPDESKIDLHRPMIDKVTLDCACGGQMTRIPEVFDCWFESASMPFAQNHFPFENKDLFETHFPAQFVTEYIAQTRTWFYYMHVVSTILFNRAPFENVVTTGTVLAQDGQKMSKSKGNFPDPWLILNQYGADALRFYLLSSPIMRSQDLNFSQDGVFDVYKKIILRLSNVASFYELYSQDIKISNEPSQHILDIWISLRLNEVLQEVNQSMDNYEVDKALRPLDAFIEDLSLWYLRRSRDRFKNGASNDVQSALNTFRNILMQLSKICAPFIPFISESIFQQIKDSSDAESIHLEAWPQPLKVSSQTDLIAQMTQLRELVSMALEQRKKANLRIRQPLQSLTIKDDKLGSNKELMELIRAEVNVKEVLVDTNLTQPLILDTNLTDPLLQEGMLREVIRVIQDTRKKAGYAIDEQALVEIKLEDQIDLINKFKTTIETETLTSIVEKVNQIDGQIESKNILIKIGR